MKLNIFLRASLIATIYFVLTFFFHPISFGPIQVRISEALTVLPYFYPESIVGLVVGCMLANLSSPFGLIDIIFGSLCTLIAAIFTYLIRKIKKPYLGILPPILINAFGVGLYVSILSSHPYNFDLYYYFSVSLTIAVGEAISVGIGGSFIIAYLLKRKRETI